MNGCNILVTTVPCLLAYRTIIQSPKLRCIAFENIDCLMEKHKDACNDIIDSLCLRKSYDGDQRQIIVTSRTWQPFLNKFLNEKLIADSVLVIGNHLESALWGGVSIQMILCNTEKKLQNLTGKINDSKHKH